MYCNLDKCFFANNLKYNIPELFPCFDDSDVKRWIGFKYLNGLSDFDIGCHFYIDDYQFERVWNKPLKYLQILKKCKAVIQTDFSLYTDFPLAIQIYNVYRNAWLARFFSENGVNVIPNVCWGDKDTYDWVFNHYPKNSTVAVSTKGMMRNEVDKKLFFDGYEEMIKRLNPSKVLCFTCNKKELGLGDNVRYIRMNYLHGLFEE